jgi:hypothetical protein
MNSGVARISMSYRPVSPVRSKIGRSADKVSINGSRVQLEYWYR